MYEKGLHSRPSTELSAMVIDTCARMLIMLSPGEVALKLPDATHRQPMPMRAQVGVRHVLERRVVVDADVGIARVVDSQFGKVVFLLPRAEACAT